MTKRISLVGGLITALVLATGAGASAANADNTTPPEPRLPVAAAGHGPFIGIVPVHGAASRLGGTSGNLTYHNGPVMHTNTTYAIFWQPSNWTTGTNFPMSASYVSLVNRYFTDVAVATTAGATSNVYYADTQYFDNATGLITNASTYAGSYIDTNTATSGCTDAYTSVCLTDAQIAAEIKNVIAAKGWPVTANSLFFMFTPKGVGTCFSSSGGSCSFSQFCAYHSSVSSTAGTVYYANMPYADTVPAACDGGQHPNGNDADATLQVTSHEHNEAITDKAGNAWYDQRGYENGDKCAWQFGPTLGSTASGSYDQVINGNPYFLQLEWSNKSTRCVAQGL